MHSRFTKAEKQNMQYTSPSELVTIKDEVICSRGVGVGILWLRHKTSQSNNNTINISNIPHSLSPLFYLLARSLQLLHSPLLSCTRHPHLCIQNKPPRGLSPFDSLMYEPVP